MYKESVIISSDMNDCAQNNNNNLHQPTSNSFTTNWHTFAFPFLSFGVLHLSGVCMCFSLKSILTLSHFVSLSLCLYPQLSLFSLCVCLLCLFCAPWYFSPSVFSLLLCFGVLRASLYLLNANAINRTHLSSGV